jgi:hypothetical protein
MFMLVVFVLVIGKLAIGYCLVIVSWDLVIFI